MTRNTSGIIPVQVKAGYTNLALGIHPAGWELWLVSEAPSRTGKVWVNVKLVWPGLHEGKTNYWLSYCISHLHFRENKVYYDLVAQAGRFSPALDTWVEEVIMRERGAYSEQNIEDLLK